VTDNQLGKAWEIFAQAAELPAGERTGFVQSICDDPQIVKQVLGLLDHSNSAGEIVVPAANAGTAAFSVDIGSNIGPYTVTGLLGRGGMGEIYSARDKTLGRVVALKLLSPGHRIGDFEMDQQIREAKAASSLNHPNIVTIYQVVETGSRVAIAMELVEGKSVRNICGQSVPLDYVCHFGAQVARALLVAHRNGIIHRDIKPENLMIRPDGYVKVLDFGLARKIDAGTLSSAVGIPVGTLRYMSPEQASGSRLSSATDIFSLGLVLFELATGCHPFHASSPLEVAHAIAIASPPLPSALNCFVPAGLDRLILAMLAKAPGTRPSAEEVAVQLSAIAKAEGPADSELPVSQSQPASQSQNPSRLVAPARTVSVPSIPEVASPDIGSGRFSRRQWLAAGGVVLLPAAAAGVYLWYRGAGEPIDVPLIQDGFARDPEFSPDGATIAFVWTPPGGAQSQIFLMDARGGDRRVFTGPRGDSNPCWSPDGKKIAFVRSGGGESALYMKPVNGDTEQRITSLSYGPVENRIDWLLDNTHLLMTSAEPGEGRNIFLVSSESGAKRPLTRRTHNLVSEVTPKCSPNGRWLSFARRDSETSADIYVMPSEGGDARRLTFDGVAKLENRWTPDSRGILFKARYKHGTGLWYAAFDGSGVRELALARVPLGTFDVRAGRLGHLTLVSQDQHTVNTIWRAEIPGDGVQPSIPAPFISSNPTTRAIDAYPAISPDGLKIAFVSMRSGATQVWVTNSDRNDVYQMTSFDGPEVSQPSWSPDGRHLVFSSAPKGTGTLFVVDTATRSQRQITTGTSDDGEPQWSRDGRWITFTSNRSDKHELWRMPSGGGRAHRICALGGVHHESADQRWVYIYLMDGGLWRIPFQGGEPKLVFNRISRELYRAWAVSRKGIYYTAVQSSPERWTVFLYNLESGAEKPICNFPHPPTRWSGALAVSPDERWLLLSVTEKNDSGIVLTSIALT
jgi:Tol biopolymer transport system component/serine/threonine protein kinase